MGELFELIFSNFLILAAIIGGIISWFTGMTKDKESKQRPGRNNIPRTDPVRGGSAVETEPDQTQKTGEDRLKEYYEEKRKRLGEISKGHEGRESSKPYSYETLEEDPHAADIHKKKENKNSILQLSEDGPLIQSAKKWDKKRLAEGILMAEVLGPPRAHKPHSSHPRKR